jgi:hypothetical protein
MTSTFPVRTIQPVGFRGFTNTAYYARDLSLA